MLELFKSDTCGYCRKVIKEIEIQNRNDITYRDIHKDDNQINRLIEIGGKSQVPCLFINGKPLYESDDIIEWLKANPEKI